MGLVITTGLTIGTLFTLFMVPAFYLLLAQDHHGESVKAAGGRCTRSAACGPLNRDTAAHGRSLHAQSDARAPK
ncbi:hypothetical protein [Dokdonella sp.]|uniref:hypothetical protein n=1 Tax=Dokdonella sp. TaxID=2291710 RepID=UPI0035272877